jgi:hypothetical protein
MKARASRALPHQFLTNILMKNTIRTTVLLVALVLSAAISFAQTSSTKKETKTKTMNTYVIERNIPSIGDATAADLQGISQKSCSVLKELGPDIEWIHSYVTDNKIFCIYKAESEEILRTHAQKGGFPINAINKLSTIISPNTATAKLEDIKPK